MAWVAKKILHEDSAMARKLSLTPGIGPSCPAGLRRERKNLGTEEGMEHKNAKMAAGMFRKNDARLNLGPLVAAVPPSSASTVRVRTGLRGVREFSSELGVGGLSSESGVRTFDREVTLRLSIEVERPTGFFKSFKVIVDGSLGKRFLLWDGVDARLYKGTTQCA